jgi:hypothetical protein
MCNFQNRFAQYMLMQEAMVTQKLWKQFITLAQLNKLQHFPTMASTPSELKEASFSSDMV